MKKKENQSPIRRRRFLRQSALAAGSFFIVPSFVLGGPDHVAPSDKITLGFLGCGKQSGGLGKRFMELDEVQLLAASDVFEAKSMQFKKVVENYYAKGKRKLEYKGFELYHDYEAMLDRTDIDGIIVALPDHWHALASIKAMRKGKDVYCEKPLAHTIMEGRMMVEASKKYQRIVQTGSMQRSWDKFRHACELVQNGYIGEIKTVKVNVGDPAKKYDLPAEEIPKGLDWDRWLGPAPVSDYNNKLAPSLREDFWPKWRDYKEFGGGILCDWGAHMFDIAQWGLGMDHTGPVKFIPPEDPKAVRGLRMIYANGIEMIHEDFGRGWAVQFNGTKGKIEVSRGFLDSDPANIVKMKIEKNDKRLYFSDNHYQDWINAIKSRKPPICDAETGHRSSSVCNLANIAYQIGEPLVWDPVKEKFKGNKMANKWRGKEFRKPYVL